MKVILVTTQNKDSNRLASKFIDANTHAAKLSSTDGFSKTGNSMFITGANDEHADEILALIKETYQSGKQYVSILVILDITMGGQIPYPMEVEVGGATCFVLPVGEFHQY